MIYNIKLTQNQMHRLKCHLNEPDKFGKGFLKLASNEKIDENDDVQSLTLNELLEAADRHDRIMKEYIPDQLNI